MATLFNLDLVTPDARILEQEVLMVVVPGEQGDIGIMAEHAPIISMLRPGFVEVHSESGIEKYFVGSGYANVANNGCTILAESVVPESEIKQDLAKKQIELLREELEDAQSEVAKAAIERRIYEEETKLILAT